MTRPRRSRKPDQHTPEDQGDTMTATHEQIPVQLHDPEDNAAFLLYRLHTNTGKAREAYEHAQAAYNTARGHEQTVAQLDAAENELRAQFEAKVSDISRQREAATEAAQQAHAERNHHMAEHEKYSKRAEDTTRICRMTGVAIDAGLPVPPTAPTPAVNGADPTPDPRLDGPMGRFNEAHDTDPAGEQAAAS